MSQIFHRSTNTIAKVSILALVLLIGIIKGTYSSVFVASPLLYELYRWAQKRGKSVVLIEPSNHLGGLTTGGLGATDIGNKGVIGGRTKRVQPA